jgi:hypothetical protein
MRIPEGVGDQWKRMNGDGSETLGCVAVLGCCDVLVILFAADRGSNTGEPAPHRTDELSWSPLFRRVQYLCLGGQTCSYQLCQECSSPTTCFHLNINPQNISRMTKRRRVSRSTEVLCAYAVRKVRETSEYDNCEHSCSSHAS